MFWTAMSCQLCCTSERLESACAATGQQSWKPSSASLPGCSTTALQQAEPWVQALMCWQLAGQAVLIRQVPGREQRDT